MKADKFNQKEYDELIEALNSTSSTDSITKEESIEIKKFFVDNKEMDYNDFLKLYNEKYGNIINQYREKLKLKSISKLRFANLLYIITFFIAVISCFIWLIIIANNL